MHLRSFEEAVQLDEVLGEPLPRLSGFGQLAQVPRPVGLEERPDLQQARVHERDVFRQLLHEQVERLVARVQLNGGVDVALHGMRPAVIAYGSEGLLGAEQAVRAAERLDDALVVDDLVEVQRVHPLRVEAREHLVDHDEDVYPLVAVRIDVQIGLLVGEPRRDILLHARPRRYGELLAVGLVVIANYLDERVFLHSRAAIVVYARVE